MSQWGRFPSSRATRSASAASWPSRACGRTRSAPAAASPGFFAGILDYVVSDEPLLIALAKELNTKPEHIMQAHWTLSPSEFE